MFDAKQVLKSKVPSSIDCLSAFVISLVTGLVFFRPWNYVRRFIFPSGSDFFWQQAIFQMHAQIGLFGSTKNLSWPIGADPWRLPQLGMLIGAWARVTVGWLGMGTATSIVLYLSVIAGVNSLAMVFFIRGIVGTQYRVLAIALAVMVSASLFTFSHQLNLSSFYIIPFSFGILFRLRGLTLQEKRKWIICLVLVAVLSPLWWVVVMALVYPLVLLSHALRRQWKLVSETLIIWSGVLAGLLTQAMIFILATSSGPGSDNSRTPWTSNYFAGHLSDLFVGSTFFEHFAPSFVSKIIAGSSIELGFGLPIMFMALVSVIAIISMPPIRTSSGIELDHLRPLTLIVILYWLGGGLGNLQAAFAVALGTTSPARAWYRLMLILGILGSGWIVAGLKHYEFTRQKLRKPGIRISLVVLVLLLTVGWLGDLRYQNRNWNYNIPSSEQTTTPAVNFISDNTTACQVAQFPNEAIPDVRILLNIADQRTYRGMIPYILEPNYTWTAGSYDPRSLEGLAKYPQTVTDVEFSLLEDQGYCAVLFDKEMSQMAIDQQVEIEGREISTTRTIDYEDSIYQVFLLGSL